MRKPMRAAVLLGSQRFEASLDNLVKSVHDGGPMAAITCGWREREAEDEALRSHVGVELVNLELRRRLDEILQVDKELAEAHRHRQQVMRHKQDFYRIRLQFALEAHRVIRARSAPEEVHREEEDLALAALKALDSYHLGNCVEILERFDDEMDVYNRPEVARHRQEIAEIMSKCSALAISGGHVATIINRLRLFGVSDFIDGHVVYAWSAGAMAISDRIVLYHDSPPQGPGASEILTPGLGWVPDVVVLPEPEKRLRVADVGRVSTLARRFRPARSLAFPSGTYVVWANQRISRANGVIELGDDGQTARLEAS